MENWRAKGLCYKTYDERFFPQRGETSRYAKGLCAHCPVKAECLDVAISRGCRSGIFGGTTERERQVIRRFKYDQEKAQDPHQNTTVSQGWQRRKKAEEVAGG